MTKDIFFKSLITMLITASFSFSQDEQDVDAIEKARQAKEAAEKAAAEASAATEAAIEAAAQKAAKEARVEAKRKKEEEEARKLAEAKAAEEAELDAAATAAAEEAKRRMAEELGLEYEEPKNEITDLDTSASDTTAEEFIAKEPLGFTLGLTPTFGLFAGTTFSNFPIGATIVLTTPYGFKVGPLDYTISLAAGSYTGTQEINGEESEFNPSFIGLGGNLTLASLVFSEGHLGLVGDGPGLRGFAGVTLDRLLKNTLNLPFNVLVGGELFYGTDAAGEDNPTGWIGFGARLDYSF